MILKRRALLFTMIPLLIASGCNEPVEKSAVANMPPVEVQVESLAQSEVAFQVELAGTLHSVEQARISARVAGQVVKLPVKLGSKVKKGDLLIKIAAAEINARVQQAETRLAQGRRNLERETKLHQVNASTREKVKSLKEQVQILEAVYREAETMLGYTEIKAPFAGAITGKQVEVGDLALPGKLLLMLENDKALEVVIQVPEAQSRHLNIGSRLPLTVPAADLKLEAQVREISPTVDPDSRTTQVKLMLPDAPALRSGQFARVGLADGRTTTLMIKRTAVRQNGQMQQVFVAEKGKARMRLVRTGNESDERIEILSGLRVGDQVVLDPPVNLRDGQPLKIADGSE